MSTSVSLTRSSTDQSANRCPVQANGRRNAIEIAAADINTPKPTAAPSAPPAQPHPPKPTDSEILPEMMDNGNMGGKSLYASANTSANPRADLFDFNAYSDLDFGSAFNNDFDHGSFIDTSGLNNFGSGSTFAMTGNAFQNGSNGKSCNNLPLICMCY